MRTKNNDHDVQFLKYGVQWTDRQTNGSDTVEVGAPPKNDQFSIFNRKIKKNYELIRMIKEWTDYFVQNVSFENTLVEKE